MFAPSSVRRRPCLTNLYFNGKGGRQRRPPARPPARKRERLTKAPEVVTRTRRRCDRRRSRPAKPADGRERPAVLCTAGSYYIKKCGTACKEPYRAV